MTLTLVPARPAEILMADEYFDSTGDADLDRAEARVAAALAQSDRYRWQAAFALNDIYESGAWRKGHDDDGAPFTNFEGYIRSARQRIPRLGVRWAQEHISMIGMYMGAMGLSAEDLMQCSPTKLRDAKRLAKYDQRKGEITGYNVPNGAHVLVEMVKDAQEPTVSTGDLRKRVNSLLRRPDITYQWIGDGDARQYGVKVWIVRVFRDDLAWDIEIEQDLPPEIIDDMRRRLGCAQ